MEVERSHSRIWPLLMSDCRRSLCLCVRANAGPKEWMAAFSGQRQVAKGDEAGVGMVLGVPLELVKFVDEYGLPLFLTALMRYIEVTCTTGSLSFTLLTAEAFS